MRKKVNRIVALLGVGALLFGACLPLASCASEKKPVLRIYNWEDYISTEDSEEDGTVDLISAFEEQENCIVQYSTFGTNENMYNELGINPGSYDLVCPSDYMIMKMIAEGMCHKFSNEFLQNSTYTQNVSPYIKQVFDENGWSEYAVGYMWGTMGYMFNPDKVDAEEMRDWNILLNEKYKNKSTIKDSVRDAYFYSLACIYQDELKALAERFDDGLLSAEEYNAQLTEIMNRRDKETIEKAGEYLKTVKKNIYGFEVDGGKNDMVTGKISINFCWSGDAAYAIVEAASDEDKPTTLCYTVPDYVSNIWFDGWVIPEGKGVNVELAEKFLNFISTPENAIVNMNYIGYTSVIAGQEVYENYVLENFESEEDDAVEYDLGYYFGGNAGEYVFYASPADIAGTLMAQFPAREVVDRCAVMKYYTEEENNAINQMWEDVKGAEVPLASVLFIVVVIVVLGGAFLITKYGNELFRPRPKKGYKKVEK